MGVNEDPRWTRNNFERTSSSYHDLWTLNGVDHPAFYQLPWWVSFKNHAHPLKEAR